MILALKIDVSKIEKDRLYKGQKGTYLDAIVFVKDEDDQYGNRGMITQSVSKEEREQGVQGAILGNCKLLGEGKQASPAPSQSDNEDLPF